MSKIKTPWNPSKSAIARVKDPAPPPEICQYCNQEHVEITHHYEIYGKPYGNWPWVYRCTVCNAMVGMHPFTNIPLGTLADLSTRKARMWVKNVFNPIWKSGQMTRSEAYEWLADAMGIPKERCHFGMFTLDECNTALSILRRSKCQN